MASHKFEKVFEPRRNRQVRGLWKRNGAFYAQICLVRGNSRAALVPLHDAGTIPQAIAAMQALKLERHKQGQVEVLRSRQVPRFCDLADAYLASVEAMGQKHRATRRRERSSIAALKEFFTKQGNKFISQISVTRDYVEVELRHGLAGGGAVVEAEIEGIGRGG
jgi:hypothetical protein